jgi:hypothetical protein
MWAAATPEELRRSLVELLTWRATHHPTQALHSKGNNVVLAGTAEHDQALVELTGAVRLGGLGPLTVWVSTWVNDGSM